MDQAHLLVAVERRVGVVLGEAALAGWVISGHGDVAVLRDADVHGFSPNHELIQMLTGDFGHPWVGHLDQGRVLPKDNESIMSDAISKSGKISHRAISSYHSLTFLLKRIFTLITSP